MNDVADKINSIIADSDFDPVELKLINQVKEVILEKYAAATLRRQVYLLSLLNLDQNSNANSTKGVAALLLNIFENQEGQVLDVSTDK